MMTGSSDRAEYLRLMMEIAAADRDEYRALRAEAWRSVVRSHERKTAEQLARWRRQSS